MRSSLLNILAVASFEGRAAAWRRAYDHTWSRVARQAKQACGPLHFYRGDLEDRREVISHIVCGQYQDDVEGCSSIDGSWSGDWPDDPHFDERVSGLAIALLVLYHEEFGNDVIECNGSGRSILNTMWRAQRCLVREQYIVGHGIDWKKDGWQMIGVPGGWPIMPGICPGDKRIRIRDISPERARYVTYNDGTTSGNCEGLLWVLIKSPDHDQTRDRILLCGEGTWAIAQYNDGWLPEQCNRECVPTWARNHEVPSWSPRATAQGVEIMMMCHVASGDDVWLERAHSMQELVDEHEQMPGCWYYFLEPKTLRPIWGDGNGRVVYNASEARWPTDKGPFGSWERHPLRSRTYLAKYEEGVQ
jgi:hypothetical protein